MHRSKHYDYWKQDSLLYPHVRASIAERLQTTTDYGRSTSQPHQHFLQSVPENSLGDSTPVVRQNHVACDGGSTTEDQTVVHDAGILPIPTLPPVDQGIAQGDIQSGVAGWHPRRISSSYPPYAFSDYWPAHNMGFSDTNLADSWLISPMQGFQHDPRHQIQEEVCAHPRYVVGDDESDSRVGCVSTCKWNDGHGICGRAINAARIGEHMISYHFKSPMPANSRLECLWKDCELPKSVRRDTIIRHIVEKHLGLKYRCKHWVASHTGAGFCGSRKNARLH